MNVRAHVNHVNVQPATVGHVVDLLHPDQYDKRTRKG